MNLFRSSVSIAALSGAPVLIMSCAGPGPRSDTRPVSIVIPDAAPPQASAPAAEPTAIAPTQDLLAGGSFTCARKADKSIWCWGGYYYAPFPDSDIRRRMLPERLPQAESFVQLAAGTHHLCGVRADRSVECWGHNLYGELGTPDSRPGMESRRPHPLVKLPALDDVEQLALGGFHTCVRRRGGAVWCWGRNEYGELGDGGVTERATPMPVAGLEDVVDLRAGGMHTCARKRDGSIWCWGHNGHGDCGIGDEIQSVKRPRLVSPIGGAVVQMSLKGFGTCARLADRTARCWGTAGPGAHPNGIERGLIPAPVGGLADAEAVAVGDYGHACAHVGSGSVWCWGHPIGHGETAPTRKVATRIAGVTEVTELALGHTHACARRVDGAVLCWGNNDQGQLGDGTTKDRSTPAIVLAASP